MAEPVWCVGVIGYISSATRGLFVLTIRLANEYKYFRYQAYTADRLIFLLNHPLKLVRSPNPFLAEATDFLQRKTEGGEFKNAQRRYEGFFGAIRV